MTPTCYSVPDEQTSPKWCEAFAQGSGGRVIAGGELMPGPVALFGSKRLWGVLEQARAEGRDWYYGDHAYFGRGRYYRVTRNGFQHDGLGEAGPVRFRRHGIEIKDWRKTGSHILICPPDQVFAALMGFDADAWLRHVLDTLNDRTDRELRVRDRKTRGRPLSADLQDCWALVTYMSNAAVEAVCEGVPVFCTGPCAGRTMGLSDLTRIERPAFPQRREPWAWNLAANQWTLDEMRQGLCWEALGR